VCYFTDTPILLIFNFAKTNLQWLVHLCNIQKVQRSNHLPHLYYFFYVPLEPKSGLDRPILEVSKSRTPLDTYTQPTELLWPSDQPVAQAATCTTHNQHKRRTHVYPCPKQGSNPPSQQSIGRRFKVRPHRTRSAAADCGLCPLRNVTF